MSERRKRTRKDTTLLYPSMSPYPPCGCYPNYLVVGSCWSSKGQNETIVYRFTQD